MASRKLKIVCIEALEAGLKWKGKRILSIDLNNKLSKEIIESQHHHPPCDQSKDDAATGMDKKERNVHVQTQLHAQSEKKKTKLMRKFCIYAFMI